MPDEKMSWDRMMELYDSFNQLVLENQWSIEGWIQTKQVTIYELDDTLNLISAAVDFFRAIALERIRGQRLKAKEGPMPKKCPQCNYGEIPEGRRFCTNCGMSFL